MSSTNVEEIAPDSLLTSHQVGALLQVNPSSINKWVKDGRIPAFRTPGGHRRIRASDLVEFLTSHSMPVPLNLVELALTRLLIVDDDEKQLRAFERLLKPYSERLELCLVNNGIDALVQVGAFKPQVILLDIFMEGLDGLEVCRRLHENPETRDMTIVMASGSLTPELKQQALDAGANHCLSKPVDLAFICEKLGLPPLL